MMAVYLLTLRQLAGRWRVLITTVLAALPIIVTLVVAQSREAPLVVEFEKMVVNGMLLGSILPLVVLATATTAFSNEVEDRTLANLTLSSVPRWQIAIPKLLGAITVAAPLVLVSAAVTSWLAFLGEPRAVIAVTLAALVALALYAAAFTFFGLITTQAIALGLLYIVVWEGFFAGMIEGVRLLSVRYYAIALMHAVDPARFANIDRLPATAAGTIALALFGGLVALTIRRLRRMDVP